MGTRRNFMQTTSLGALGLAASPAMALGPSATQEHPLQLSLAQWSLHRTLQSGKLKAEEFPFVALETYGIPAVEYVNQFYTEYGEDERFWIALKKTTDTFDITNVLIMVDDEGELGDRSTSARKSAVENHYKWVHAAKLLGCSAIRVNAFGSGNRDSLHGALVDGLGQLAAYASQSEIRVLVENHGMHTSDGAFMVGILKEVNSPNLGTLPDFGNWCLNAEWGSTQNGNCDQNYGPVRGVTEFLPYAGGVSAKSYDFDDAGNETVLDYPALLKRVKESGYNGRIGIEFEGERLSEPEGIKATKALLERTWNSLP